MARRLKRWVFNYHFPYVLVKYANQQVIASGRHWTVAAARADREISKREGIKGMHKADMFKRTCYPIEEDHGNEDIS